MLDYDNSTFTIEEFFIEDIEDVEWDSPDMKHYLSGIAEFSCHLSSRVKVALQKNQGITYFRVTLMKNDPDYTKVAEWTFGIDGLNYDNWEIYAYHVDFPTKKNERMDDDNDNYI